MLGKVEPLHLPNAAYFIEKNLFVKWVAVFCSATLP
jgi:hypothetical protein